ncbi:MAG: hypothetical protein JWN21_1606 [Sphingomonas bacterium]|uniref:head-tail connector protein n=1 Tax=Sphingomonas bacterium TaxID=1895847 RepID=UPI002626EDA0|nr:hypothetical protein [Sphingomonas bacterium]MDB5696063.1 hypothetical protein [Sphingomonas bacterium]
MTGSGVPASVVAELVAAARGYARVADGVEAGLLARAAETAVATAEAFCGIAIFARGHEDVLPVAAGWQRLRATPVTAIAGVTGLPVGLAPFVVPVGDYVVDIEASGDGWVRVAQAGGAARVAVSYTAGLAADWASCPPPLAQGLVMLVAHLFADREGQVPPAAVAALWRPFRRMRLLERVR